MRHKERTVPAARTRCTIEVSLPVMLPVTAPI